jgi:hypothetical protein
MCASMPVGTSWPQGRRSTRAVISSPQPAGISHPSERQFIDRKAKELAAQTCKSDAAQCMASAYRYWNDQLTSEAEAANDSKLARQRVGYLQQMAAAGQVPGSEGQTSGGAQGYLHDALLARQALNEVRGQAIAGTDGKAIAADGATLTYFSGTPAQRDDHNLYAVRPGAYDSRVSANGSATDVVPQANVIVRQQRDAARRGAARMTWHTRPIARSRRCWAIPWSRTSASDSRS